MFIQTSFGAIALLSLLPLTMQVVLPVSHPPRDLSKRLGFNLVIAENFPDPTMIKSGDTWYAFATNSNGNNVQIATSTNLDDWTILSQDAFPREQFPPWIKADSPDMWAPDVYQRDDGKYLLTYSAAIPGSSNVKHCVGIAISDDITGPYTAVSDDPFSCPDPNNVGGDIDSSYFKDSDTGILYLVYKVDGNSIGKPTPILIQQLASDGFTPIGGTTQILVNEEADGPVVEAPVIVKKEGLYVLFFSSNAYNSPRYDVRYATATAVGGPYVKNDSPLLATGNNGLAAPGGADVTADGTLMFFHGNIGAVPGSPRGMYVGMIEIDVPARKVYI